MQDVSGATATILRHTLEFVRNEEQIMAQRIHRPYSEPIDLNSVSYNEARRIALHIYGQGSVGALARRDAIRHYNGGYTTPVEDFREFFNRQITEREAGLIDAYVTADFVRAYAHALQRQADQQLAQAEMERRRALRSPAGSTTDLPSGITFENQRPTPPSTPPTLRLTENPYGDGPDQSSHHRHHRRHRP
jgi:hypothetical protein